jgi:hypothetical protein
MGEGQTIAGMQTQPPAFIVRFRQIISEILQKSTAE